MDGVAVASIEPLLARVGMHYLLLVRVATEDGIDGWGESRVWSRQNFVAATLTISPPRCRRASLHRSDAHNPLGPIWTAATAHLGTAAPDWSWAETRQAPTEKPGFHDASLFTRQIPMEGAVYVVPNTPGRGVEVDEAALRAGTPEHVEPPHLRRPDGSVTNWWRARANRRGHVTPRWAAPAARTSAMRSWTNPAS